MNNDTRKDKQKKAKGLLVHCLKLPNGVAARQAESLSDEQLDAVCAVASEHPRNRRQVLKAVMAPITEQASAVASPKPRPEPESTPGPEADADSE